MKPVSLMRLLELEQMFLEKLVKNEKELNCALKEEPLVLNDIRKLKRDKHITEMGLKTTRLRIRVYLASLED